MSIQLFRTTVLTTVLPTSSRFFGVLLVTAFSVGLAACDGAREAPTVGQQVDSAIQKTEQAFDRTQEKINSGEAGAALRSAGDTASDLAADASITAQVSGGLARDAELSAIQIDVDTHDGAVRLSGPASSEEAKERATTIARSVSGVRSVNNELIVKPR